MLLTRVEILEVESEIYNGQAFRIFYLDKLNNKNFEFGIVFSEKQKKELIEFIEVNEIKKDFLRLVKEAEKIKIKVW